MNHQHRRFFVLIAQVVIYVKHHPRQLLGELEDVTNEGHGAPSRYGEDEGKRDVDHFVE